jgi:hypothetical protein
MYRADILVWVIITISPPSVRRWLVNESFHACAHVYIYITDMRMSIFTFHAFMCIYLNYLYLLSRMHTCLYYKIFTAKHAPCLYLHSTHYAYISIISIYFHACAHVYIYGQAWAMSKFTLIYAHMSTFKFPACADLYIYICGIYTCIQYMFIFIFIFHQAHDSYIPRMCTMHIAHICINIPQKRTCFLCLRLSCAYVFIVHHFRTQLLKGHTLQFWL